MHTEVLRLLLLVCKDLEPPTLASYLGHMLEATAASRARASSQKKKFASITAQYGSHGAGGGLSGVPGYISMGGAASEWSDGFRTVRSLKYGGSSDGYSELYHKLVAVGSLKAHQDVWPQALKQFMQVGGTVLGCLVGFEQPQAILGWGRLRCPLQAGRIGMHAVLWLWGLQAGFVHTKQLQPGSHVK